MGDEKEYEQWLATRPEVVQKLAREFPPGTVFVTPLGERLYVIGYSENGNLVVSEINPREDFDGAMANKRRVHAQCVRDATVSMSKQKDEADPVH